MRAIPHNPLGIRANQGISPMVDNTRASCGGHVCTMETIPSNKSAILTVHRAESTTHLRARLTTVFYSPMALYVPILPLLIDRVVIAAAATRLMTSPTAKLPQKVVRP